VDRESVRDYSFVALLIVACSLPGLGFLLSMGGHPTVVEYSRLGIGLIGATTFVSAVAIFAWLLWSSRSDSIDVYWPTKRKQAPLAWLRHILGLTLCLTAIAGLFAWRWVDVLVRAMPSQTTVARGTVTGFQHGSSGTAFCRYFVDVDVDAGSGRAMELCEQRGLIFTHVPAAAAHLEVGDSVTIQLSRTALGTTGEIR